MAAQDLGTKRTCPDCGAKFYDFGAEAPFTCPKCSCVFTPEEPVAVEPAPKPVEKAKPKPKPVVEEDDSEMNEEMGGIEALEDFDDDYDDDVVSLEEVEDHHEDPDVDPEGDDAEDDMFMDDLDDHEKIIDSYSSYEDELESEDEDE